MNVCIMSNTKSIKNLHFFYNKLLNNYINAVSYCSYISLVYSIYFETQFSLVNQCRRWSPFFVFFRCVDFTIAVLHFGFGFFYKCT